MLPKSEPFSSKSPYPCMLIIIFTFNLYWKFIARVLGFPNNIACQQDGWIFYYTYCVYNGYSSIYIFC